MATVSRARIVDVEFLEKKIMELERRIMALEEKLADLEGDITHLEDVAEYTYNKIQTEVIGIR